MIEPEDDDGRIVERAIGIEEAHTDQVLGVGPCLKGDASEDLEQTSRLIGGLWLPAVEAASFEQLGRARDQWSDLVALVIGVGDVFGDTSARNLAGFPALARSLQTMDSEENVFGVVMMLRIACAGDPKLDAAIAQLHDVGASWQKEAVPAFRALRTLRDEVPAFASALGPEQMRAVINSQPDFAAHLESLRPLGEQHEPAVWDALRRAGYDMSKVRPPVRKLEDAKAPAQEASGRGSG